MIKRKPRKPKELNYPNKKFDAIAHNAFVAQTIKKVAETLVKELSNIEDGETRWLVAGRVVSFLYGRHYRLALCVAEKYQRTF